MDNKLDIHNRLAMDTRTCFQLYQIVLEQSKHKHDMETTGFQRNNQNKSYNHGLETIQLTQNEMDKIDAFQLKWIKIY
jgi:hypothetical protein